MSSSNDEHVWCREQMAAALAGGLCADELARFEGHLLDCPQCALQWQQLQESEKATAALFEAAQPAAGLEDRVIRRLREDSGRQRVFRLHPAIRYAVSGVAAAVLIGGLGYLVNNATEEGGLPNLVALTDRAKWATNVRRVGQAQTAASNESRGYSYANPYPQSTALASGFTLNAGMSPEFALAAEINPRTDSLGDGHTQWVKNPFVVDRDSRAKETGSASTSDEKKAGGVYSLTQGKLDLVLPADNRSAATVNDAALLPSDVDRAREETTARQMHEGTRAGHDVDGDGSGHKQVDLYFHYTDASNAPAAAPGAVAAVPAFKPMELAGAGERAKEGWRPENAVKLEIQAPGIAGAVAQAGQPSPLPSPGVPGEGEKGGQTGMSAPPADVQSTRKIIRNGQMEFEVERFDSAFAQLAKLTQENGGYVGTTQSEKLPNGKVKGTVTLRVPPERLDTLVLQLRGIGDLKSQKLEAQDIGKQYQDLESELKADRAMEERLLEIIKTGKGEIKDLLAAEKELGVWRGKIEKIVGEMKYFDSLVALSTLNITLYEKDIRTPAAAIETEMIDAGVETVDVEKARADALAAIEDVKGRVIQSDLKRYDAGQFGATIVAEVASDRASGLLDRLKQIGKMARLDIQRKQTAESGADAATRVEKKPTRINLSLYNLANVAPRVTTTANIAAEDVEAAYRVMIARVEKAGGRIVSSNLNKDKAEKVSATIGFELPAAEAEVIAAELKAVGEMMKLAVSENPDVQNVTTAKRGFTVQLFSVAGVAPRETMTMQVAAASVSEARGRILDTASAAGARVLSSVLNEGDRQNITANLDLEIRREKLAELEKALAAAGDAISRNVNRSSDAENTIDSKIRLQVSLIGADRLAPRETTTLGIEVGDVEAAMAALQQAAGSAGGKVTQSNLSKDREGRVLGRVALDVPLASASSLVEKTKAMGKVRMIEAGKNAAVPEGKLARARIEVTLGNAEAIVEPGRGLLASVRQALSTSATGLLWSLELIIVGLCFVMPWVIVLWGGWRIIRRTKRKAAMA